MAVDSDEHLKLTRSWNTAVKIIWNLPHPTHTRFLESLSPVPHLESTLHARYIGFADSLAKSSKPLIGLLFNCSRTDLSSQTGQNIQFLCDKYSKQSLGQLTAARTSIKKARVSPLSENENWKLKLIEEVSMILKGQLITDFDDEPLWEEILEFVCTT